VLLSEPTPTAFDVRFSFFGVPVRITPFFWVAAFLIGHSLIETNPTLILLWIAAVLVSILVHELGHVWAFHYYGIRSSVVLYHFGGLAVPSGDSYFSSYDTSFRYNRGVRPQQQMVISAAGPAVQLMLGMVVFLAVRLSGHHLTWAGMDIPFSLSFLPEEVFYSAESRPIPNQLLADAALFIVYPSVFWAIFNLIPIYPLDGGQIARQIFILFGGPNGVRNSLVLSIVASIGVALWGFSNGSLFTAIFFGSLAFYSYK
jgi:stage IV sporulation protein FB